MTEHNRPLRLGKLEQIKAFAELVRLPNLFTSMADVAMGMLFVMPIAGLQETVTLALLLLASTSLYAGGVVLNDVFDYERDLKERPERPLPSGRISRRAAAWLGAELLILGMGLAWTASFWIGHLGPGIAGTLLAGVILLYDGYAKHRQWLLGPLIMGGCRALNVALGMSVVSGHFPHGQIMVVVGVLAYVTGITWFARTEARRSNRVDLAVALAVIMSGIVILAMFPYFLDEISPALLERWRLLITILGLLIGWRFLRAVVEPSPPRVQAAVKHGILSLVMLDAAVCWVVRGPEPAVMILALLIPAMLTGRWIRST